jgi:hypothetical protein
VQDTPKARRPGIPGKRSSANSTPSAPCSPATCPSTHPSPPAPGPERGIAATPTAAALPPTLLKSRPSTPFSQPKASYLLRSLPYASGSATIRTRPARRQEPQASGLAWGFHLLRLARRHRNCSLGFARRSLRHRFRIPAMVHGRGAQLHHTRISGRKRNPAISAVFSCPDRAQADRAELATR